MHVATGPELTAAQVYAIWQIRDTVFQCEQAITEPDADGIDLLATCTHLWLEDADGVTSYLRTFVDGDHRKLGRVCTRRDRRGRGLSGRLLAAVHERWPHDDVRLSAQAYLEDWYAALGYVRTGPTYLDAGIDHVPMLRQAP